MKTRRPRVAALSPLTARKAGLRYVSPDGPGITRHAEGSSFAYRHPSGNPVRDKATLRRIRRGHDRADFERAMILSVGKGFQICVHIILGLPGEGRAEMLQTAEYLAQFPIDSIKIHNLHVVRGTVLAREYQQGRLPLLSQSEYVELVCEVLERLPPRLTVQRLCADAPEDLLLAPSWCIDKPQVLAEIRQNFARRGTAQGGRCSTF